MINILLLSQLIMEWTGIEKKDFVALPSGAVAGGCTEEGKI